MPIRPQRSIPSFELIFPASRPLISPIALRPSHRPALVAAFPAKNRPPLRGTEGNCGFLPALRTVCLGFRAHWRSVTPASPPALGSFGFRRFSVLGFVLTALVGEQQLFPGRKNQFSLTLRTPQ